MRHSLLIVVVTATFALTHLCGCHPHKDPVVPKLRWVYVNLSLLSEKNVAAAESVMERAARAGFTGIALADFKLNHLGAMPPVYFQHVERIKLLAAKLHLEIIPCIFPLGHSSGILSHDPNLAEAQPVTDADYVVRNGTAAPIDSSPPLRNAGFDQFQGDSAADWDVQDGPGRITFIDTFQKHGGKGSLRIGNPGDMEPIAGNARIGQRLKVRPFHSYRVEFWIQTRDFGSYDRVRAVVIPRGSNISLVRQELGVQRTQAWKRHFIQFNSEENTEVELYIGSWGEVSGGALWLDDVSISEAGMSNIVRRDGCPLEVRGATGMRYEEGRDFEPVHDLVFENTARRSFDLIHVPPTIRILPASRIKEGERLQVSFYQAAFTNEMLASCCLTSPRVYSLLRDQMRRVEKLFHPTTVFMQHDEIRVANWCGLCQARRESPGQLLADNVGECEKIVHEFSPNARIWVWNDMFDPNHNAKADFYLARGSFADSWQGLSKGTGVVNWNYAKRGSSMGWFANRGHNQILAGFYDGPVDQIQTWLADAGGIRGIDGVMYTTWRRDYSQLEAFARAAWGARNQ